MQMNGRHPIKDDSCNNGFIQHSLPSVGRRIMNKEANSWRAKYNIHNHICLHQLQMSTVTTHSNDLSLHPAKWTNKLTKPKCRNQRTKIELHPQNINSKDGFFLVRSQKLLIHSWMEGREVHHPGQSLCNTHPHEPWTNMCSFLTNHLRWSWKWQSLFLYLLTMLWLLQTLFPACMT